MSRLREGGGMRISDDTRFYVRESVKILWKVEGEVKNSIFPVISFMNEVLVVWCVIFFKLYVFKPDN